MNYQGFIENAYTDAKNGISNIPTDSPVLKIKGMSRAGGRHLLNNLAAYGSTSLEIGTHQGSTLISYLYQNPKEKSFSIDNWSQFGNHKETFKENVDKYLPELSQEKLIYFDTDCWKMDLALIDAPIDFYFYDGRHTKECQRKALTYYYPVLNNTFLFCVDDYCKPRWGVAAGTQQGIEECGFEILAEKVIRSRQPRSFWNGYYIAFLKKTTPES